MITQKLIGKLTQIRGEPEVLIEFLLNGKPGEGNDDLTNRFLQQKYPPAPEIARPIKPEIKPMLSPDAPFPKYDQTAIDAAAKLEATVVFETRWLNISAGEAL